MTSKIVPRGEAVLQALEELDQINARMIEYYQRLAQERHQALSSVLRTERETAISQLKSHCESLEKQIREHREVAQEINVVDIAEMYEVAGMTTEEALLEARKDFDDLKKAVTKIEEAVQEVKADYVCGFPKQNVE